MLSISETNNLLHPLLKMVSIHQKLYLILLFVTFIQNSFLTEYRIER